MAYRHAVGIDIGTYHIKVVVVELAANKKGAFPRIIGTGYAESKGMRYGYIINVDDVQNSLKRAIVDAEKTSGISIKEALLSIGGVSLDGLQASGSVIVSRGDGEVTENDLERLNEAVEQNIPTSEIINKKILHNIPLEYALDGKRLPGQPTGLKGVKLEMKTLFVTCFEQHLHDLVDSVEGLGITVLDVVAAPLAAGIVNVTGAQKIAGCVLANVGSETVSIVVYEEGIPISLSVFPIGSNDITNDIALGLQISLEEAEQIKLGGITGTNVSRKKLDEIVSARLTDIFELISSHLKKVGRHEILPAGIIITGGGSGITTIDDLAKGILKLPSRVASLGIKNAPIPNQVRDASWSVAYGLGVIGLTHEHDDTLGLSSEKKTSSKIVKWIKNLLP